MTYIQEFKDYATMNGDDVDRITFEPLNMLQTQEYVYRHGTIPLEADGCIQFWDTEAIWNWISDKTYPSHPMTRKPFTMYELNYIEHYYNSLQIEKEKKFDANDESRLYNHFVDSNYQVTDEMRIVLTPQVFLKYFKNYVRDNDSDNEFERMNANKELENQPVGTWLFRYSTLNHRSSDTDKEFFKKHGIKFWVFSFVNSNNEIVHKLFVHRPGWGWGPISNYTIRNGKIHFYGLRDYDAKYFVCFVDVLRYYLINYILT